MFLNSSDINWCVFGVKYLVMLSLCFVFIMKCLLIMSNKLLMQEVWWSWQFCFYCNKSGDIIQGESWPFWGTLLLTKNGVQDSWSQGYYSQITNLTAISKLKELGAWKQLWYLHPENSHFWIVLSRIIKPCEYSKKTMSIWLFRL